MSRRRNPNLKKAHELTELDFEKVEELKKCITDPTYFTKNYVFVTHPTEGRIPFELYDYQEDLIESYNENKYNIVLSARQTGKTETSCAFLLWYAIFHSNKTVLIVSNKSSNAMEIIEKIQNAYEDLPHWIKPGIDDDSWNKHTCAFDNKSRIIAQATAEDSGRSLAISLLYCDEFAFVKPHIQEKFWDSVFPTLSCLAEDTLILTENGFEYIKDIVNENDVENELIEDNKTKVYSHINSGLQNISHRLTTSPSKVLKIKTETGREISVTPSHPLTSLSERGEDLIRGDNLKTGDYLRIDTNTQHFGSDSLSKDEAYMLGGYVAEGWINQNSTIWISNTDEEFRKVFVRNGFRESKENWKLRLSSRPIIRKWEDYGVVSEDKCYSKKVPSKILKSDKQTVCNFLAGLFDGDGSITDRSINLTTTSKTLSKEVQILLNNLGIVSRIFVNDSNKMMEREKQSGRLLPQGKPVKSLRDSYSIDIPLSQYEKFNSQIPLKVNRKKEKIKEIINFRDQNDFKQFYIPVNPIRNLLERVIKESEKNVHWFRKKGLRLDKCLDSNSNRKITKRWLDKLLELIEENSLSVSTYVVNCLSELNNPYVCWERIVSIEENFAEKTYDITVPQTGVFLQNGILGSNTGGKCIISSTPNGDTDMFATLWRGAEAGVNGFKSNRIYWDQPPGRDESFKEEKIAVLGERKWLQEYECEFISSDESLFDSRIIQIEQKRYENIKPAFVMKGEQEFWKPPAEGMSYIVGVDPATGSGNDFSVIEVFEFPSMIQMMEFRSNTVSEGVLYSHLKKVLGFLEQYSEEVYFSIENNGVGRALIALYMNDSNPPNFSFFMSERGKNKVGFTTTAQNKRSAALRFKNFFERREMTIFSPILYNEMKSYIAKGASYEAQTGSTDDCIAAVLIIMRMLDEISMHDERAFNKLYSFADKVQGDEWYTEGGGGDMGGPLPAGVL